MQIIIKDKALTDFLTEVIEQWYDLRPDSAKAMETLVREESKSLIKPSGMSRDGTILSLGKVPSDLYSFIKWQCHKRCGVDDFFRDQENYRLLYKIWDNAAIRRKPTNRLYVSGAKT